MNAIDRELLDYETKYGNIPDDKDGRILYVLGKKATNQKFLDEIDIMVKKIKKTKSTKIEFILWKVLKPSARPRVSHRSGFAKMYVPHASANGEWFTKFMQENKLPFIDTPCSLSMDVYEKTPSSFNMKEKALAEMGFIRPWKRTGDFDNYAKAVADMIQHGMLADDYLVIDSDQHLFYSCKPHVVIRITYMNKFPEWE